VTLVVVMAKSVLVLGVALLLIRHHRLAAAHRHLVLVLAMLSLPWLLVLGLSGAGVVAVETPPGLRGWAGSFELPEVAFAAVTSSSAAVDGAAFRISVAGWYAAVSVALFVWWLVQVFTASRWIRSNTVPHGGRLPLAGARRPVTLRCAAASTSPFTWGAFRPVVVIPSDWSRWPAARRRAVLTHEMAHVRRWDTLVSTATLFVACLFWINPLVWIAHRRLLGEAELACDDTVVSEGVAAADYAGELLALARARTLPMAHAAASQSTLARRIRALVDPTTRRTAMSKRQCAGAAALAALLICPVAAIDARPLDADRSVAPVSESRRASLETIQALIAAEELEEALEAAQALLGPGLNGNELAQTHNMLGYIHFKKDDYETALEHYLQVTAEPGTITKGLEVQTYYTAAQLSFVLERYSEAIAHMQAWQRVADAGMTDPVPHIFIGQVHYKLHDHESAIVSVRTGLELAEMAGTPVKESWLALLAYLYYEEGHLEDCIRVTEELRRRFPDGKYDRRLEGLRAVVG
jgi:tetratricopeptide (TPR) repeat protein